MDFARRQLEKYGWTDGKGLGRNENGISQPLKPKLKRSVAGIGHDQAAELTDPWWNKLYDKAAKNIEVQEKNGKTKKIKTKDDNFKITNSSYHLNKSDASNQNDEYSDFFVRTAVLTNGGCKEEKVRESESEEEAEEKKDVFKMTDEELFAACEGRTAHKGARHGLKATGKLARIERQEQMLLALPKYTGYSHSKKHRKSKEDSQESDMEVVECTELSRNEDCIQKKKKKKRKRCFSGEKITENLAESVLLPVPEDSEIVESTTDFDDDETQKRKKKKKKNELKQSMDVEETHSIEIKDYVKEKRVKKKKETNKIYE